MATQLCEALLHQQAPPQAETLAPCPHMPVHPWMLYTPWNHHSIFEKSVSTNPLVVNTDIDGNLSGFVFSSNNLPNISVQFLLIKDITTT